MSDQVMDSQMKNESLSSDREADKMGDNDSELNCRQIVCKRCSSVILRAKQAKLLDKEVSWKIHSVFSIVIDWVAIFSLDPITCDI